MIHLHVRDRNLRHVLDVAAYRAAIQAIRSQVGGKLVVQVTTESCGLYRPEDQIRMIEELKPEAVSLSITEIIPDPTFEARAAEFFGWMSAEKIFPQWIVFNVDQVEYLAQLIQRGVVPTEVPCVLYVLGRYTPDQISRPSDLNPFLEVSPFREAWFLCAFGRHEAACVDYALGQGGHARIGFENNCFRPDGHQAASNAELVSLAANHALQRERPLADADQARELFARRC